MMTILPKDLSDVASSNHSLISYSWVALPLVYTQLVTMAVYLYFFFTLFSSQNIDQEEFGGFLQVSAHSSCCQSSSSVMSIILY